MVGMSEKRRTFIKQATFTATGLTSASMAGCLGGGDGNGSSKSVTVPAFYDLSGPSSAQGVPYAEGSRDAWQYMKEQDVLPFELTHDWIDSQYDQQIITDEFQKYVQSEPPVVQGWGTMSSELLGPQLPENEIVMVSAAYAASLLAEKYNYNFFCNLSYSAQARCCQKFIHDRDPDAKVVLMRNDTSFGESPSEAVQMYAEELGQDLHDDIVLPLGATSAESQLQRAKSDDVDWIIHNNLAVHQVLLSNRLDVYPDVNVIGLGWAVNEGVASERPEAHEGTWVLNGFRTFQETLNQGGKAEEALRWIFENIREESINNKQVANMDYLRGFINPVVISEAFNNVLDMDGDIQSGSDFRQGMFDIDEFEAWGISPPLRYEEGDRRPTMTGLMYQIQDGEINLDETIELERTDKYYGV